MDGIGFTYHFRCDMRHTIPTLENVDMSTIKGWIPPVGLREGDSVLIRIKQHSCDLIQNSINNEML